MGMHEEENACSSGYGLRATMGLGKLEEVFHFIRSQLKRRQWGVYYFPPSRPPSLQHIVIEQADDVREGKAEASQIPM